MTFLKWSAGLSAGLVIIVAALSLSSLLVTDRSLSQHWNAPRLTIPEAQRELTAKAEDKIAREIGRIKSFRSYGNSPDAVVADAKNRARQLSGAEDGLSRLPGHVSHDTPGTTAPTSGYPTTDLQEFEVSPEGENRWVVQLDARQAWAGTGISLSPGDTVIAVADGLVCSPPDPCSGPSGMYGPARTSRVRPEEFPAQNARFKALIARVGDGQPFQLEREFTAIGGGELRLMSNIRLPYLHEASGGYRIALQVIRKK